MALGGYCNTRMVLAVTFSIKCGKHFKYVCKCLKDKYSMQKLTEWHIFLIWGYKF